MQAGQQEAKGEGAGDGGTQTTKKRQRGGMKGKAEKKKGKKRRGIGSGEEKGAESTWLSSAKPSEEEHGDRHAGSYLLEDLLAHPDRRVTLPFCAPSSTSSSSSSEPASEEPQLSPKKTKVAMLFGYLGARYGGLQINELRLGWRTVEAELERALFLAGSIIAANFGNLSKIKWARAGRTDKGVHAATQLASCKLEFGFRRTSPESRNDDTDAFEPDLEEMVHAVNSFLPDDIRVFEFVPVTKSFNARFRCIDRRYTYFLPSYMLRSASDVEAQLAECERELPPPPPPSLSPTPTPAPTPPPPAASGAAATAADASGEEKEEETTEADETSSLIYGNRRAEAPEFVRRCRAMQMSYRVDDASLARFRELLALYDGTHSFHNFTSGMMWHQPQATRVMRSVVCGDPFVYKELEWLEVTLFGQSFLLNQIRKMVAVAVDHTRRGLPNESLLRCFDRHKLNLPIAPATGLFLDKLDYQGYNESVQSQTDRPTLDWEERPEIAAAVQALRNERIKPFIFDQEDQRCNFMDWLQVQREHPSSYDLPQQTPEGAAGAGAVPETEEEGNREQDGNGA